MQLTERDEQMIGWLSVVRMADVDAIRWALAGFGSGVVGHPVGVRRANQWIARMAHEGLLDRLRPIYRDRQIVWPTYRATGRPTPVLFRQTMRHELAVAEVAARYLAQGYTWARDRRPPSIKAHQADGVATRGDLIELVEVELTAKKLARYQQIHLDHGRRILDGEVTRVIYFCTPDVARAVAREADHVVFRDQRSFIETRPALTDQGKFIVARSERPVACHPEAGWPEPVS